MNFKKTPDPDKLLGPVERAHEQLGLTYGEIAQIIGADASTLHRWRRGDAQPSPIFIRQGQALERCLQSLRSEFESWEAATRWLNSNLRFSSAAVMEASAEDEEALMRPYDLLIEGQTDRVLVEIKTRQLDD